MTFSAIHKAMWVEWKWVQLHLLVRTGSFHLYMNSGCHSAGHLSLLDPECALLKQPLLTCKKKKIKLKNQYLLKE